jgi:hypothetical protein
MDRQTTENFSSVETTSSSSAQNKNNTGEFSWDLTKENETRRHTENAVDAERKHTISRKENAHHADSVKRRKETTLTQPSRGSNKLWSSPL